MLPIRDAVGCLFLSLFFVTGGIAEDHASIARGIVFHDRDGNRQHDPGEQGIAGIRVSNGTTLVTTDAEGHYEIPVADDTILFVIKPRGWRTPLNEHRLPQFYYIHKPHGSPESRFPGVEPTGPLPASVDFPLYPQKEPNRFRAVLFADPQPRNQQEVDYVAHDVVEELIGTQAAFGVTLGDIVFDDLDVFEPLNATIALIGIPWYNVIGNHDINRDAKHDHHSDETFERIFGPAYYSFDYGPAHFIVVDDVEWYIADGKEKGTYRGGIGNEQLQFLRADLEHVPEQQLVVLLMHIPLTDVHDRQALYRLIEKRPFSLSISGHTHYHEHRLIDQGDGWRGPEPHHHVVNVTVSGSWWSGAPDERGIPHTIMTDGAPNGYSLITFDGHRYTLDFKAAGRSAAYQMQIAAPESVSRSELRATPIYVNFFNGSERARVEMRLGKTGAWHQLKKTVEVDPSFAAIYAAEQKITNKTWRDLHKPRLSGHLWKGTLGPETAPGTYLIEVRATDMHGRSYWATRVLRVTADQSVTPVEAAQ